MSFNVIRVVDDGILWFRWCAAKRVYTSVCSNQSRTQLGGSFLAPVLV